MALSRGLTAADGASLNESYRTAVTILDLPPGVDFSAKGMFLPRQGQGLIGLEYVNTDELVLTVSRVFSNNLSALFQDHGYAIFSGGEDESSVPYHLGSEIYRESFSLQSTLNKKEKRTISRPCRSGSAGISIGKPSPFSLWKDVVCKAKGEYTASPL